MQHALRALSSQHDDSLRFDERWLTNDLQHWLKITRDKWNSWCQPYWCPSVTGTWKNVLNVAEDRPLLLKTAMSKRLLLVELTAGESKKFAS